MVEKNARVERIDRRQMIKGATAAGVAAAVGPAQGLPAAPAPPSEAVGRENERPGTTDWQLTYTRVDPQTGYRSPPIEGYASRASVKVGERLNLMVSTNPAGPFTIDIYRLGYYGGDGGRHMTSLGAFDGTIQEDPEVGKERLRECQWKPCTTLTIPAEWPSGVYLAKLSLVNNRYQSYITFIVREDRRADILFQCSDNTWQAYNRWPDHYSLYDNGQKEWSLGSGVSVSYDRPYGKYCQVVDAPLSQGSGEFLLWEFPLAFWLEQHNYDVVYCSNTDVHADEAIARSAKTFLSVGHDEYWSLEQFNHVRGAVEAGVNVAFLSGNTCCFVAPLVASSAGVPDRVLTRAGRYGGLTAAEQGHMGPFAVEGPNEATLIGARTITPFNGSGDWIVADPDCWIFKGTGMKRGDRIPGLVGWEFHGDPAPIPGLKVVAAGTTVNGGGQTANWSATLYPGPKGNWVFNASTIYWSQALSSPPGHVLPYAHFGRPHGPDARVERITHNVLERFLS